jgi:hypothetical protein
MGTKEQKRAKLKKARAKSHKAAAARFKRAEAAGMPTVYVEQYENALIVCRRGLDVLGEMACTRCERLRPTHAPGRLTISRIEHDYTGAGELRADCPVCKQLATPEYFGVDSSRIDA